jgi:hypothetical protein
MVCSSKRTLFWYTVPREQNSRQLQSGIPAVPTVPLAGSNSTQLNLSILDKEDQNVVLVFTSLLIKEKESGKVVKTFPFAFHDFSDVTFPYMFEKAGTYVITLLTKINGDPI